MRNHLGFEGPDKLNPKKSKGKKNMTALNKNTHDRNPNIPTTIRMIEIRIKESTVRVSVIDPKCSESKP